jgi:hypothetical protein
LFLSEVLLLKVKGKWLCAVDALTERQLREGERGAAGQQPFKQIGLRG